MDSLEQYIVKNAPDTLYYIPNFITAAEEEILIQRVNQAPKPKWTQLRNRRLQNWGGLPHAKGIVPEQLPQWLTPYCKKIGELGVFDGKIPNHVLVNEYKAGQGIMPHLDGSLYYPTVSTISLGSHTLLNFYEPLQATDDCPEADASAKACSEGVPSAEASSFQSRYMLSMLLEPRSLVLVRDSMYSTYLHGISEVTQDIISDKVANIDRTQANTGDVLDRGTRISLTIRVVPKVLKTKLLFGKR